MKICLQLLSIISRNTDGVLNNPHALYTFGKGVGETTYIILEGEGGPGSL